MDKVARTYRLTTEAVGKLAEIAKRDGTTVTAVLEKAIQEYARIRDGAGDAEADADEPTADDARDADRQEAERLQKEVGRLQTEVESLREQVGDTRNADMMHAQDELRHENELLRVEMKSLQERLEDARDYMARMDRNIKEEREGIAKLANMVQSTQVVTGMTLTRTAPTDMMEVVPQAQAPRMTLRQRLSQWLAR